MLRKPYARSSQPINVRGLDDILTITAQVTISKIIRHDKNDIWTGFLFCIRTAARHENREQEWENQARNLKDMMESHDCFCICSTKNNVL